MVPVPPMAEPKSGRHYLPSFSTHGAVLEKIVLQEMEMENRSSVVVVEERKREAVL